MKTYYTEAKTYCTEADFLKDFPIKDGIINLNNNSVQLLFDLVLPDVSIVKAQNIKAWDIKACNIKAWDINAWNIIARDIKYYGVCFAYQNITCKSIIGRRENAKHFCLDGKVIIEA